MKRTILIALVYLALSGIAVLAAVAVLNRSGHLDLNWAMPLAIATAVAMESRCSWRREALTLVLAGLAISAGGLLLPVPMLYWKGERILVSPATLLCGVAVIAAVLAGPVLDSAHTVKRPRWITWITICSVMLGGIALSGYWLLSQRYNLEASVLHSVLLNVSLLCGAGMVSECLPDPVEWCRAQRLLGPLLLCGIAVLQRVCGGLA